MRNASVPPPLIVRVAGLPAEAITAFSHPELTAALRECEGMRERLGELRAALVDCLHGVIRTAAREERRFLLAVKRSCYNGGALRDFEHDPLWPLLSRATSDLAAAAVALESAIEEREAALEGSYQHALRSEREHLVRLLEDRAFVRGVALASPDVAQNLDRLHGCDAESFGRREKRLCLTLVRYASRAALKLSPFSTLTRTGLLRVAGDADAGLAFLPGAEWSERSTVSLRRELLEQCTCLLLRCREFAAALPVTVNETLVGEGEGTWALFRPGRWELDHESGAFRYREPSSVKARLEGPLIPWLLAELRERPLAYRPLAERALSAFADEDGDSIVEGIAGLLGVGFLNLVLPWSFTEPDLERKILDHLGGLEEGGGLDAFRDRLGDLTGTLGGYAGATSPARILEHGQRGVEGLFQALASPASVPSRIEFKAYDKTFEEEVFLQPEPDPAGSHEIARLSEDRASALLEDLNPLARLMDLHSDVHDLLYTLAAFGERRWRGAREVGLLELFGAVHPLFNEALRYRASRPVRLAPGFNPLGLGSVRSLSHWRERVENELDDCFEAADGAQRLCPRALGGLLDRVVPAALTESCAPCFFVQPLDPAGGSWILNTLKEGFGCLGSRFTSGMDAGTREAWSASFLPLSFLDLEGERTELVDMACPGPRTINVHVQQTCRVLKMPGEHATVAPERCLRLSDLRVRLRGADLPPVLTDAAGRRLLPVPLGSLAAGGRPTLLKFLAIFGPREYRRPLPVRPPRAENGAQVIDRHLIGRIVYARKKWQVETPPLLSALERCSEAAAFAVVNRWRLGRGIPDRVFVQEPLSLGNSLYRHKPQYLDFSSPSFLQIFRSVLKVGARALVLEEALPVPEQFPGRGRHHWASEIQLESFVFRREFFPLV